MLNRIQFFLCLPFVSCVTADCPDRLVCVTMGDIIHRCRGSGPLVFPHHCQATTIASQFLSVPRLPFLSGTKHWVCVRFSRLLSIVRLCETEDRRLVSRAKGVGSRLPLFLTQESFRPQYEQ
ncbi:hypothetical protein B0J18DRAFT_121045 [Chaetomium sp. MPI-SDFR-AT-0129]|nr:hypothetical protein B0J18DRAFT_121045 [Chaetomium sp. MPI-SDFR-AT-0129]